LLFQVREHPFPGKVMLYISYPGGENLPVAIGSDTDYHEKRFVDIPGVVPDFEIRCINE